MRSAPRTARVRVQTARGRKLSSSKWLERQLNDPYVAAAKQSGYRSRAAWKLAELDDKFGFLKKGARIVDLGAAPGGWMQVAVERVGPSGRVVGIDLNAIEPVPGAEILEGDATDPVMIRRISDLLGGDADAVLSDMGAPATGHRQTDHLRSMALCEAAFEAAKEILAPGGTLVVKALKGGTERDLLNSLKRAFARVQHVKPPASRQDSAETYLVATDFRKESEE